MSIEGYPVERVQDKLIFIFESVHPVTKKSILKIITYALMDKYGKKYYNLGFGDYDEKTGLLSDKTISNNGDMRKVLRTVVSALEIFFQEHPNQTVHVEGSDSIRNSYYQKIIIDYADKIQKQYYVQGFVNGEIEDCQPQTQYQGLRI